MRSFSDRPTGSEPNFPPLVATNLALMRRIYPCAPNFSGGHIAAVGRMDSAGELAGGTGHHSYVFELYRYLRLTGPAPGQRLHRASSREHRSLHPLFRAHTL